MAKFLRRFLVPYEYQERVMVGSLWIALLGLVGGLTMSIFWGSGAMILAAVGMTICLLAQILVVISEIYTTYDP
jgi:hypothetical protein